MSGQERKKKAEDFMAAMVAKCAKMVDENGKYTDKNRG